jgi:hypothetical protein
LIRARLLRVWPLLICLPLALWAGCATAPPITFILGQRPSAESAAAGRRMARLQAEADLTIQRVTECLGLANSSARATVRLFGSRRALREYLAKECPHQANSPAACFETEDGYVIALCEQGDEETLGCLRHETTHYVLAGHFYGVPPWADEGLAQYFEIGPPTGRPDPVRLKLLVRDLDHAPPGMLTRLVSLRVGARLTRREYAQAWGLVSFLMSRPRGTADVRRYLQLVRADGDPQEQFRDAFGCIPDQIEADFRAYAPR